MAKVKKEESTIPVKSPVKTSLVIDADTMEKVRYIAFHEKQQISDIVSTSLQVAVREYEKKNGAIQVK